MAKRRGRRRHEPEDILILLIGYVVTSAWAISFLLGIIEPKYSPPSGIQGLMMVIAGSAFALPIVRKASGRDP